MARRRKKDDSTSSGPTAPFWMTTYGDMVTLLLAFFVLLFSFSTIDAIKWEQVINSLKGTLGVLEAGKTLVEGPAVDLSKDSESMSEESVETLQELQELKEAQAEFKELKEKVDQFIKERNIQADIHTVTDERGLVLRFSDQVLFDKAKAELKPDAQDVLKKISILLKDIENQIRVEGHTDNLRIHTEKYPSNWELSAIRATNVVKYLQTQGIDGKKLSSVGYGEYRPLVTNKDEESRQKNRRVDILILTKNLSKKEQ